MKSAILGMVNCAYRILSSLKCREILNHGLSLRQEVSCTVQIMISTALWPAAKMNLPKRYFGEKFKVKHTQASTDMHLSCTQAQQLIRLVPWNSASCSKMLFFLSQKEILLEGKQRTEGLNFACRYPCLSHLSVNMNVQYCCVFHGSETFLRGRQSRVWYY